MSKVYGGKLLGSSLLLTLLWLLSLIGKNEAEAASAYYSPSELGATNYEQLNALFKDYLKVLEQVKTQPKHISGQVNLRAPRSELVGDMAHALRLYQLAELDRMYGAKSRPRFGKRGGITQEDASVYGGGYDSAAPSNDVSEGGRGPTSSGDEEQRR